MKFLGIDLSLRSTGLVLLHDNTEGVTYKLVTSDSKKLNDEELLIYNSNQICEFIEEFKPDHIALEGLSFGSISGSKDIIAGNFWHLRTSMFKLNYKPNIIAVLSWRSPLFNKEERVQLKQNDKLVKELKAKCKGLNKKDKKRILEENEELILKSSIKYLTWEKLPANLKPEFEQYGFTKGCFDLTDAYFIANHLKSNLVATR